MEKEKQIPKMIFFYANGMTAVCNKDGEQIVEYQGTHEETLTALKKDNINWKYIPEIHGAPNPNKRKN